jgi:hypothetical protein
MKLLLYSHLSLGLSGAYATRGIFVCIEDIGAYGYM